MLGFSKGQICPWEQRNALETRNEHIIGSEGSHLGETIQKHGAMVASLE